LAELFSKQNRFSDFVSIAHLLFYPTIYHDTVNPMVYILLQQLSSYLFVECTLSIVLCLVSSQSTDLWPLVSQAASAMIQSANKDSASASSSSALASSATPLADGDGAAPAELELAQKALLVLGMNTTPR
jgi:hypothetical protein